MNSNDACIDAQRQCPIIMDKMSLIFMSYASAHPNTEKRGISRAHRYTVQLVSSFL